MSRLSWTAVSLIVALAATFLVSAAGADDPQAGGAESGGTGINVYLSGWRLAGPIPKDFAPGAGVAPTPADGPIAAGDDRYEWRPADVGLIDFRTVLPADGTRDLVAYAFTTFSSAGGPATLALAYDDGG